MSISETLGQLVDWFDKDRTETKAFFCPKEQQEYQRQLEQERAERDSQWRIG